MGIAAKHAYRFGFLKSDKWRMLRLECLKRDDAKCRLCKERDLSNDAHHIRYPKNWNDTAVSDLVTLCRRCHEAVHEYIERNPDHGWKKLRQNIDIPGVEKVKSGMWYRSFHLSKIAIRDSSTRSQNTQNSLTPKHPVVSPIRTV